MVDRRQDVVIVKDEPADLREVFYTDLKIPTAHTFTGTQEKQLAKILTELASSDVNQAEGSVQALAGLHHFPLRKTLFSAFILTVSLTGSVMAIIAAPPAGAVALIGTVLAAAERASSLITKLDPTELAVYNALATLTAEGNKNGSQGYTAADVQGFFQKRGEDPPDVEGTLSLLREKKIVKSRAAERGIEHWVEL